MQKKPTSTSAFLSPKALFVTLIFTAACFVVIPIKSGLPYFHSHASANSSVGTLTFEERVSYQRAIEEVYWRHRIWPKERKDTKPSLDAVMSQAQLEKKVKDYLRYSQALEDYWQRPITAEQLQAEIDRMAKQTKQPEVLQELFEALGNDPFIIAECLAKSALAERLLTTWYAYDQRIHGELKRKAEAELAAHPPTEQMKRLGGNYNELELIRRDTGETLNQHSIHGLMLNNREWQEAIQNLASVLGDASALADASSAKGRIVPPVGKAAKESSIMQITTGVLSSLREDESRYYATAVVTKTNDQLTLATVSWPKEPLRSWVAKAEPQVANGITAVTASYTLPTLPDGLVCSDNTWTAVPSVPGGRAQHTAIWTGTEMIVWGGINYMRPLDTGEKYNPATNTWSAISTTSAPQARSGHTAVWTGTEMIIWGGYGFSGPLNTGARYDPVSDHWAAITTAGAPATRSGHTAIWTDTEMIVWGGAGYMGAYLNTGGKYNPVRNSWSPTSIANAPVQRIGHTGIWTGSEMIIWGGQNENGYLNAGGKYNPVTNAWTPTNNTNAPDMRFGHTAVWSGSEMIIWGGQNGARANTGGRYNPNTNSWITTSAVNAPEGRYSHTAVWSGSAMIVWGGFGELGDLNTGGRYNPASNSWVATSTTNAPSARDAHTAIWTGSDMIIFGGGYSEALNTGGRYNATTDTWTATPTNSGPAGRGEHTTLWTGAEMIVWGGALNSGPSTNTGGRYDPVLDSWSSTTTSNAPDARYYHTAVWTGSEMIVWGGDTGYYPGALNTGGRYNPATNGWTQTSTSEAPDARRWHTAVWTGTEMIVWGGEAGSPVNTGGRYNPSTNAWVATSTTNAPDPRIYHTAIWTGDEMIVWGGGYYAPSNTGGKYDPSTNSWIATNTATQERSGQSAVWTGQEMIVWGGYSGGIHVNTGARYNSSSDSWIPTTAIGAPDGRIAHAAVWTGNDMIVWGGYNFEQGQFLNTGGAYDPATDHWTATSTSNAPSPREVTQAGGAVWTGMEMIVWGGYDGSFELNTGSRYCPQSGPITTPTPTPTATPCIVRCGPTPRSRPTPNPRPTPP